MSKHLSPDELESTPLFNPGLPEAEREIPEALQRHFLRFKEWELFGACLALWEGENRHHRINGAIMLFERAEKAARLGSFPTIRQTELYPFCDFTPEQKQAGMIFSDLMVRALQYFPSIPDAGGGLEYRALETFYCKPGDFLKWAQASGLAIPAIFQPLLEGGEAQATEAAPKAAQAQKAAEKTLTQRELTKVYKEYYGCAGNTASGHTKASKDKGEISFPISEKEALDWIEKNPPRKRRKNFIDWD